MSVNARPPMSLEKEMEMDDRKSSRTETTATTSVSQAIQRPRSGPRFARGVQVHGGNCRHTVVLLTATLVLCVSVSLPITSL
jgi:hypothetical protein